MTSKYWGAGQAHAYHEFQYDFPEKTLAGRTIIVAGGTGGLGVAIVALLAREGAHLVVGYSANRERAAALCHAMKSTHGCSISLVAGDVGSAEVRVVYLATAQKIGAPLAGVTVFPRNPARVAFENLKSETLLVSLESNYVGPIVLAKECGAARDSSAFFSNATITSPARPWPLMAASRSLALRAAALTQPGKGKCQNTPAS
jgi:NAD(P)-dependent dehydrogenase (short-subunit alcohol dehydrogenase family)